MGSNNDLTHFKNIASFHKSVVCTQKRKMKIISCGHYNWLPRSDFIDISLEIQLRFEFVILQIEKNVPMKLKGINHKMHREESYQLMVYK